MRRFWKIFLIFWPAVNLLLIITACSRDEIQPNQFLDGLVPDEIADSVFITSIKNDIVEFELSAQHIKKFYHNRLTVADTVFITTYTATGEKSSTLYCDQAEMDETRNIMIGTGNVIITSENGILKTPYLVWDQNSGAIVAQNGVTLIRENNILRGYEMLTDIELNHIEITRVSAEGQVDEEDIDW